MTRLIKEVIDIAKSTAEFIHAESLHFDQSEVRLKKGFSDLVSYVDRESERMLVEALGSLDKSFGFIAEEGTGEKKGGMNWIIDPLDGTTNFIHGLPVYSISIALVDEDGLQLGVVYDVANQDCFYAEKDDGAYRNGEKIQVSGAGSMKESLIATGFPYYEFEGLDSYLSILRYIMQNSHGLRRMGSAALDLAWTACGRFEGFFEYNLNAWDVAAGALIVKEAGGVVSDFKGKDDFLYGRQIIAGNSPIHHALQTIISERFKAS